MANTGYKGYAKLLKTTDDGTHRALDVNNELCSESGLPQDFKTNINTDPDYVAPVYDVASCPVGGGGVGGGPYTVFMSNSTATSNCAGAGVSTYPIQITIEDSPVLVGDIIYQGSDTTTPFPGDGTWYSRSATFSMRINSSGVVTEIDNSCAPPV
jgi:hypothetical protein